MLFHRHLLLLQGNAPVYTRFVVGTKGRYIMPCLNHFYQDPMQIVKGEMQYLYDSNNKKYLDCFAGVSVINCGHCNPVITDNICEQVKTLQHVCNIYLTENYIKEKKWN